MEATTMKQDKYAILQPLLTQLGYVVILPIVVVIAGIKRTIHNTIIKYLKDLKSPPLMSRVLYWNILTNYH